MKNLLFQLDTDPVASSFDTIVAYDGGADAVQSFGAITPESLGQLIEGCMFSRPPREKCHTAIIIGGSSLGDGEDLLDAVRKKFFGDFRVSVMLDSNGANTTAAAAAAMLNRVCPVAGKSVVVLAGTGPVGQRAAMLMAQAGAAVSITSRSMNHAQHTAAAIASRSGCHVIPIEAFDAEARASAIAHAHLVFAAGAAGVQLLHAEAWENTPGLLALADANATPAENGKMGIAGIDPLDRGTTRHGKTVFGAIGFGAFKLDLQRACIRRLFERHDLVLDAEEIFAIARERLAEHPNA